MFKKKFLNSLPESQKAWKCLQHLTWKIPISSHQLADWSAAWMAPRLAGPWKQQGRATVTDQGEAGVLRLLALAWHILREDGL